MKTIFKSILGIAAASLLAVSCNVDAVTTKFDPNTIDGNGVTFLQTVATDTELPASTTQFTIMVGRAKAAEAQSVPVVSTLPEDIVCPTSISFAAGEYEAPLVLDISKMGVGSTYKGTVSLGGLTGSDKNFSNTSVSCTFAKAYSWVSLGKGQFLDTFWEGILADVEILKADGFEIYRVMNPYAESKEGDGSGPAYISIYNLGGGQAKFDTYLTPYLYDEGMYVKAYFPSEFRDTYAQYDELSKFMDNYYFAFVPVWYVDGLGGWGVNYGYTLFVALPGAPKDLGDWYDENFG